MKTWYTRSGYKIVLVLAGRSNVFLLTDGNKNILIDTSIGLAWNLLKSRLQNLKIKKIDYLVLTHSHFDHAANAFRIKNEFGAMVVIHKNEAGYLLTGKNHIPGGTSPFTRTVMSFGRKIAPFMNNIPCACDILVESRYDLKSIGFNAYILFTPGHSPGSVSVIIDDEIALVGDCMIGSFKWTVFPPFADDAKAVLESWETLLLTNCNLFMPSHGKEIPRNRVQRDLARKTELMQTKQSH